jgi:hypothetical protein
VIARTCFSREWIDGQARKFNCRNPHLLEKAIVALQLVGHLVETGLPFQFKGGTSLLLLVRPIRRLSIDADIVTQATPDQLDAVLKTVGQLPPFTRIEHDPERDGDFPPKKHYRAFYPSVFDPPYNHVLLDVLFEKACVAEPIVIGTTFIQAEREVRVRVPSVNGLLGDKLTAFAPQTIGILYDDRRKMDIVKQLFDIGVLFDVATDLAVVATSYEATHANQCRYRKTSYTLDQTLDDTLNACVALSEHGMRGALRVGERGPYFQEGIQNLEGHLVTDRFALDQARVAAGKAACVAAWIKHRPPDVSLEQMRFNVAQIQGLQDAEIRDPWRPLTRLKGGNPEAFFYWRRAQQLLNGDNAV